MYPPPDAHALAELDKKLQLVRDRVPGVARGYVTGLFLFGNGGIGKSYTVLTELRGCGAPFRLLNSRVSGHGLYDALGKFPDVVHVLEDVEQLFRDKEAQGVLRSALWGQRPADRSGPTERTVTWRTNRGEESFLFTGGLVMLSNVRPADLPQLDAVRTRIATLHLQASDAEVRGLMRRLAAAGFDCEQGALEPAECAEVCEHILGQLAGL